jgi:hypothetical protein
MKRKTKLGRFRGRLRGCLECGPGSPKEGLLTYFASLSEGDRATELKTLEEILEALKEHEEVNELAFLHGYP